MLKILKMSLVTLLHFFSKNNSERQLETQAITDQPENASDYSRVQDTVMMLPYILVLDMVARLTNKRSAKKALDLCCGPGHFVRMMAKNLNVSHVTGVDLSEPALAYGAHQAWREDLSEKVSFEKRDVTSLKPYLDNSFDVVSFMNGAHHMNSASDVTQILKEADRVCKPDGVVIVIDPVRQNNNLVTKLYHRFLGEGYVQKGLLKFNQDFMDSLKASFSTDEFFDAIPGNSERDWVQLIPFGLPTFQILVGLPKGRRHLFDEPGLTEQMISKLVPNETKIEWNSLKTFFRFGRIRYKLSQIGERSTSRKPNDKLSEVGREL